MALRRQRKKRPMTPQQIQSKVNEQASARFDEVIGRVFTALKHYHTHQSWRGECYCDYCCFIRGDYVRAKLALHQIKKRLNYLEWSCSDTEIHTWNRIHDSYCLQLWKCHELKQLKKLIKEGKETYK